MGGGEQGPGSEARGTSLAKQGGACFPLRGLFSPGGGGVGGGVVAQPHPVCSALCPGVLSLEWGRRSKNQRE